MPLSVDAVASVVETLVKSHSSREWQVACIRRIRTMLIKLERDLGHFKPRRDVSTFRRLAHRTASVDDVGLQAATATALKRSQLPTIGSLVATSNEALLGIRNFKTGRLDEVLAVLTRLEMESSRRSGR